MPSQIMNTQIYEYPTVHLTLETEKTIGQSTIREIKSKLLLLLLLLLYYIITNFT